MSRHILALYDSEQGQTPKRNHVHANAEVILNHLGCIVDYWDIAGGLPGKSDMKKYAGVLTWFYSNAMKNPEAYLQWASDQVAANKRFVVLGNLGAFKNRTTSELVKLSVLNEFTRRIGFAIDDQNWTDNIARIKVESKVPEMVEFERTLDYELSNYEVYKSTSTANKVYLRLTRTDLPLSQSDMVLTTVRGGFAGTGYVIYAGADHKNKWRINPFKFFEEAFGLKGQPRPDVTTLNGQRIWCSHIDGDALISKTQIKQDTYCGEIVRDEILAKSSWPVSVSVVVGEIETGKKFQDIARSIYQLDWIEAASHSYSHPFYWADDYPQKDKYEARHLDIPGYTLDVKEEIIGSVKYINEKLLPKDKKIKQFFWTGNCEPTAEALRFCQQISIANINGGDTVFDKNFPSYTNVAPLSVNVGGYRQIYAPNANENIYTNEWQGPYYGFKYVLETFRNTESPIRIKPIDIYYHFYIGERWASLNSLQEVLRETMAMDVAPMFMSDYIDITQGFFSTEIEKLGKDTWKISNYGACSTIRFDNTSAVPNLNLSTNVLGFNHYQGSLYIHLDNAKEAMVYLGKARPTATYLAQGSHRVSNWDVSPAQISFKAKGYGKGKFVIKNMAGNKDYLVAINETKRVIRSDVNGTLQVEQPMQGTARVTISQMQ